MSNLLILLIVLAIPMINSLAYFFTEKKGSLTKRFYLKYIILYFVFYIFFIYFITIILDKYNISENNIIIILELIFLFSIIGFYIFLIKKYFSFNDINLFFIFSAILSFIIMNIGSNKGEAHYYAVMMYFFFFIPLCWILFFINVIVQQINSEKRKKQSQSNVISNEEDSL